MQVLMNVSAASGRSITSLRSHAARLNSAQQHPWDAVSDGRSKLRGINPQRLNKALRAIERDPTGNSQENTAMYTGQSILSQSACPCCSYILLRHIDLEGIYWRCSHCYQEMPGYQPLHSERNN